MRFKILRAVAEGSLRRCHSGKISQVRKVRPLWALAGGTIAVGAMSYYLLSQQQLCELSPMHFTPYQVTYKRDIDSCHFIMELTPLQKQKINLWARMKSDRLWSIEVKQPQIMVARSYTPLPLQVDKMSGQLKLLPDGQNANGKFLLYVKQYGNGEVARWLHGLPEGHVVDIRGPFVEYELPSFDGEESRTRNFFFKDKAQLDQKFKYQPFDIAMFTAGTGVVAALQLLLTEFPFRGKMLLCYSCRSIDELGPLKPLLLKLQEHGRVDLHVFESSKQEDAKKRLKNMWDILPIPTDYVGLQAFRGSGMALSPVLSLVCGPDRYISTLAGPKVNLAQGPIGGLLQSKGWTSENFRIAKRFAGTVQTIGYKQNTKDIPGDATIFSMVQPTGKFHLGNYLGATRVWEDLCHLKKPEQKLLFGVADLHALTIPKSNVEEFRNFRNEAIASILAVGIDPSKAAVMHQSSIPQHCQLHWLLSTLASMGYLNRMTQWKSKSNLRQSTQDFEAIGNVKLGLFSYPVLQAADVLIYKSTHVPVGDDQSQHLELTRHLAEQFNSLYKTDYFPLPRTLLAPTKKILSLSSPDKKMSKSDPDQESLIYVNDEPNVIAKKIKKAVTDSITDHFNYDPVNRPGVSNLLNIVSGIQKKSIEEVEKDVSTLNNFKDLKKYVTEVVVEELSLPRKQFARFMKDPDYLNDVVRRGTEEAQELAEKHYKEIANIVGL